jgi:hypothetical protein
MAIALAVITAALDRKPRKTVSETALYPAQSNRHRHRAESAPLWQRILELFSAGQLTLTSMYGSGFRT